MDEIYEVVYDANTRIEMTKKQVQDFLTALNGGKDIVEFNGQFLTKFFRVIVRKELEEGRLHDGTKVIKRFGQWVDAQDHTITLDASYYPEIANDNVLSEEKWQGMQKARKQIDTQNMSARIATTKSN